MNRSGAGARPGDADDGLRPRGSSGASVRAAILVFNGFDELDVVGPYEVLQRAAKGSAGVEPLLASRAPAARVRGSHGLAIEPDATLDDGPFDLLVVPGGGWVGRAPAGAYAEVERGELPLALRGFHADGATVAAVCTGALLASAAGLLRGRPATTHHGALEELRAQGAEIVDARVVDDGDVLTCGGVTAGIDLALWIVEREWGTTLADAIAGAMEHERRGPIWTRTTRARAEPGSPGRSDRGLGAHRQEPPAAPRPR